MGFFLHGCEGSSLDLDDLVLYESMKEKSIESLEQEGKNNCWLKFCKEIP